MKKSVFLLLISALLWSCEAQKQISVTCLDAETKLPLEGVTVNVNAGLDGDYNKSTDSGVTDTAGHFETQIMIGCPGKCYDIYITYSKEGYDERKDLNVLEGNVLLTKIKH